jgi:molybdenum cofactor biosynthesis enzyme MoaA
VSAPAYLRVVLTTDCSLACHYCHAEGDPPGGPGPQSLPLDDAVDAILFGVGQGVRKVKLLGGEPLLYRQLPELIRRVRAAAPSVDLSLITGGVVTPDRVDAAFESGLNRMNVSIHGWSPEEMARRTCRSRAHGLRTRVLERVLSWRRPLKLNYVVTEPAGENADLGALLAWAVDTNAVVAPLDDLNDLNAGAADLMALVRRLRGEPAESWEEADPCSLPTRRWRYTDGLIVEFKDRRLGDLALWPACRTCLRRASCGEGIHAVRVAHDGLFHPCLPRRDLGRPLLRVLRVEGHCAAVRQWIALGAR